MIDNRKGRVVSHMVAARKRHTATRGASGNTAGAVAKRQISYCRFRLAQLGRAVVPGIVLVFIGLLMIGCLTKHIESDSANTQGEYLNRG